jgi:PPOX class probable F420-dependent enzyme
VSALVLNEATRRILDAKSFATVATLNPDGGPQTSVVWVKRDGDTVLFTTTAGRQKGRNLARDPRVSLTIIDAEDPYRYVEIRGTVELVPDPGNTLGTELSRLYTGEDPPAEPDSVKRFIVRVIPEKVTGFSA